MLQRYSLRKAFILFSLLASSSSIHAQSALSAGPAANMSPSANERDLLSDRSQWKEIETERSIFSSSFRTPDNRVIIQYSELPLNYYKNNMLVPVRTAPASSSAGLCADQQPYPVCVKKNGSVIINSGSAAAISFSANTRINDLPAGNKMIEVEGTHAIMRDILRGIDKTFEFRYNSLKYNFVLNQSLSLSTDLIIEEELDLPAGSTIQPAEEFGMRDENGWKGMLTIKDQSGAEIGTMRGALCYDANGQSLSASYQTEQVNGIQKVRIIVPASWINDPARAYPITIDPLVTGPTSTWSGGLIPSCLAPANHADSILITIPAQITVTGFFVSGSYYASPFTTAVMSDGQMYFSTSCAQTTNFTVAPPIGSTAGTGYLTNYDLRSPLLCCFPQSCAAQSFYLKMHLYRTAPGTGCNSTYIYHDPFSGYPFSAYVEGHTAEAYGAQWNVIPTSVCANVCTITGNVFLRYGVPPYTITHPWMSGSIVAGTPSGCSLGNTIKMLTLTVPGCPSICDTSSSLTVPPPVVTDACGNIVSGMLPETIVLKPAPDISASPNPATVCSGIPFSIALNSCLPGSTLSWSGNFLSGSGNINDLLINNGTSVTATTYQISASNNGCSSDTISMTVNTDPLPVAAFNPAVPVIVNTPALFQDNSTAYGGPVNSWSWSFGDNTGSAFQDPLHTYAVPGVYPVCLSVQTSNGCVDTVCQDVTVIPAELAIPNVITPNGDNINDFLYFNYLEYFGSNNLKVFDRWGTLLYEKENYRNDWNASSISDGTYYFILNTSDGKSYPGFVQVIH